LIDAADVELGKEYEIVVTNVSGRFTLSNYLRSTVCGVPLRATIHAEISS
jgi:hypothetical protein